MLNPVIEAALDLQAFCQRHKWQFCFIGGVAVQRWGEPRFTNDCDLTLTCNFGDEDKFLPALLSQYRARMHKADEFARQTRVLLLHGSNSVPMDVALGSTLFEQRSVKRASAWRVAEDQTLITCSPEDLIIHKAFAGRDKDWIDVETILSKQHGKLDFKLIWNELRPLIELKEEPEIEDKLRALIGKIDRLAD